MYGQNYWFYTKCVKHFKRIFNSAQVISIYTIFTKQLHNVLRSYHKVAHLMIFEEIIIDFVKY